MSALSKIQQQLKAPKSQRNDFGKYNYRSCEDILEAVKPLLAEHKCILTLSDRMIEVGGRVYVEATARFTEPEKDSIDITACAREAETKKGMDDSQITGAASSYARKYALNGLFCIDDTRDADATNQHGKGDLDTAGEKKLKEQTKRKDEVKGQINNAGSKQEVESIARDTEHERLGWPKNFQVGMDKLIEYRISEFEAAEN